MGLEVRACHAFREGEGPPNHHSETLGELRRMGWKARGDEWLQARGQGGRTREGLVGRWFSFLGQAFISGERTDVTVSSGGAGVSSPRSLGTDTDPGRHSEAHGREEVMDSLDGWNAGSRLELGQPFFPAVDWM